MSLASKNVFITLNILTQFNFERFISELVSSLRVKSMNYLSPELTQVNQIGHFQPTKFFQKLSTD